MGKYIRGSINEQLALATLAAATLVSATFDEAVQERTLVSSIVAAWSLSDFTDATGDGPIMVGVAHNDYSDAEIEAVIEATGSWDEGDLVQQELSKRKIRRIGIFGGGVQSGGQDRVLNDGKVIKTKLNWILNQGQTLKVWAYNLGSSSLTTGALVRTEGHANLWPR